MFDVARVTHSQTCQTNKYSAAMRIRRGVEVLPSSSSRYYLIEVGVSLSVIIQLLADHTGKNLLSLNN